MPYGERVSVDQNGSGGPTTPRPLPTDPALIEAEIEARRVQLAATVDELVVRANPREIARRGAEDAKARLRLATRTPDGHWRVERVAAIAGAAAALMALIVWNRRRKR